MFAYIHESIYKCIAHYIAKVVTKEERKEKNLDPTNYTRKIQTNKQGHLGAQP